MSDSPKLSLKEKQWNLREDAILDAASELMLEKGYTAMTMDDIATHVGISKATLYQHFASKHELVINVACRTVDRGYQLMTSIAPSLPAVERFSQLIDKVVEVRFGPQQPTYFEAVSEIVEILETDHPFIQKEQRNLQFIRQVLSEVEKDGHLVPGLSGQVVVQVLLSALRCIEMEKAINRGEINAQQIAETLKRMIIRYN